MVISNIPPKKATSLPPGFPSPAGRRVRVEGKTTSEAQSDGVPTGTYPDFDAGWFFVLEERAGELRFGADVPESNPPPLNDWNELNWQHLVNADPNISSIDDLEFIDIVKHSLSVPNDIAWGLNSANMAYILFQPHVRVAIHADQMIK